MQFSKKAIAFNANDIWRQCYELSKQLQDLHIVTCIPVTRQRFGNHIPAPANAQDNMASIVRKRGGEHASSRIEAVFSV
jgi:hypothetical protein